MTDRAPSVWVDRLSLSAVWVLRRMPARARGAIFYESTAEGWMSAAWLARAVGVDVRPLRREIGDLRGADGSGLRYAIEDALLDWLPSACDRLLAARGLTRLTEDIPEPRVRRYLMKAALSLVRPAVTMAHVARATVPPDRLPVLVIDGVAAEILRGHPILEGFEIRTGGSLPASRLVRRMFALLQTLRAWLSAVLWNMRGITASAARSTPQIAVQMHLGVGASGELSDCPWLPSSGIDAARITIYADHPHHPLDRATADRIQAGGHTWINCRSLKRHAARGRWSGVCLTSGFRIWRRALHTIAASVPSDGSVVCWEFKQRISLAWQVAHWEAWCRRHAVAVLITWADTGTTMLAQAIAVERAGGISAAWQWSHYSFDAMDHLRDHDVFFSWGPFYLPGFRRERSRIGHLVYVGHAPLRPDSDESGTWRSQLEAAGARRVVCVFDNSFSPDIHYSERAVRQFYGALLAEVVADRAFALMIKPKADAPEFMRSLDGFAAATATGRCLVLSSAIAPRAAARAADLAVGFGLNSAAIEAAIAGCPAVHVDLSGNRRNPLHAAGEGTLTFTDVDTLMRAMRHRLSVATGPIGDHGSTLADINVFGDSQGGRRMGWFLRRYLEVITAGAGRDAALDQVTAEYQRQFVRPDRAGTFAATELSLTC